MMVEQHKIAPKKAIFAASLGAVFEWYDFFLYGTLAVFFGQLFFPSSDPLSSLLNSLAVFGAGFVVRPLGGAFFGYIGDKFGRKVAFLATIITMGLSTAMVGMLPSYEAIGIAAPIILVMLRLLQGLALGGEYGGAAIYVAEHVAINRRGFYTSWIQTTATLGFFASLAIISSTYLLLGAEDFKSWGWRIPFLVSIILLLISVYIRLKLQESPIFSKLKNKDQLSKKPLRESFTRAGNRYYLLLALIVTAGQGAICYAGQLYALIFLQNSIKLDMLTSYLLVGIAQLIAIPFFPLFGWLSDRVGRKAVLLTGLIVPVFLLMPAFEQLSKSINPALSKAEEKTPVVLIVPAECSAKCQEARKFLAGFGISYQFQTDISLDAGHIKMQVGQSQLDSFDPNMWKNVLQQYQYPMQIDYTQINYASALLILSALMICVALIYAPIGAFLVDIFPAQIRYSSLSVTYHIGSGWFGGFMPLVATALVSRTGDIHAGIWYPTIVGAVVFILTLIFMSSQKLAEAKSHDAKILEHS